MIDIEAVVGDYVHNTMRLYFVIIWPLRLHGSARGSGTCEACIALPMDT
jgi:hypothetical protein